jgi:AhpD family alkylhydroperoxidase
MRNCNDYRNQNLARVGEIGKLSPEPVKGCAALSGAGAKTGHLDAKTRELIALAVAITPRCDGCIAVHTAAAKKLGASKEEIAEALGVGITVNAGAVLVYSTRPLDAFEATTLKRAISIALGSRSGGGQGLGCHTQAATPSRRPLKKGLRSCQWPGVAIVPPEAGRPVIPSP